jgi:hypothetical protein
VQRELARQQRTYGLVLFPFLQNRIMASQFFSPPVATEGSFRTRPPRAVNNVLKERTKTLKMERPPHAPSALRVGLEAAVQPNPTASTAGNVHRVISALTTVQPLVLHAPQVVMASSPARPAQAAQQVALKA